MRSGGREIVFDGATASGVVSSGGTLELVGANPNVSGTTLRGGAILELADHLISSVSAGILVKVLSGGIQEVHSGTASGTTVESSGQQNIFSGGTAINTKVHSAGLEQVEFFRHCDRRHGQRGRRS